MIVIIDNYDSFTYNLVDLVKRFSKVLVCRNDEVTPKQILDWAPRGILISPGPGRPGDGGVSYDLMRDHLSALPVLGVCLGHQSIGQVYGGDVVRADRLMHGKTSEITHDGKGLFAGLAGPFTATRYHSLIVKKETLPDCLEVTAWTDQEEIMGLRHKEHPVHGVQFHPESILTEHGYKILANFLEIAGCKRDLPNGTKAGKTSTNALV